MEKVDRLVTEAQGGALEAYGELVTRMQDMAYGYAYSLLGDFHLAEDAAQEAFIDGFRLLGQLREPAAFPAWLRRIVRKHCDRMKRRAKLPTVPLARAGDVSSAAHGPAERAAASELRREVLAAVAALPAEERTATTLFYINGYSQTDIADFLEVTVTTVKNRLRASRRRLEGRMISMVDETLKSSALPDGFAEVVVREISTLDELAKAKEILGETYHARHNPSYFDSVETARKAGIYLVEKDDDASGAGYYDLAEFSIGHTTLKAARPLEFAAEAESVPAPAFVASCRGAFRIARGEGVNLAIVHGSMYDHAFCGFVPCFYYPVASITRGTAMGISTGATLRAATGEETAAARREWLENPYGPKMSAYPPWAGAVRVVEEDGLVTGYVGVNESFDLPAGSGRTLARIGNVSVRTRQGALAVLRLAAELADVPDDVELLFMQSHMTLLTRTILSLGGSYTLKGSCDLPGLDAEMVAILSLSGLTRELAREFESRLASSAASATSAALSIEMDGQTVGFVCQGGSLSITDKRQQTHRELPRWVVTRLYNGYYSGLDVLEMGPIPSDRSDGRSPDKPELDMKPLKLPAAQAALFKALFPSLYPVSWPDPDVWPWVVGLPHPKYQHEEAKTPEMKAAIDALQFPWLGY